MVGNNKNVVVVVMMVGNNGNVVMVATLETIEIWWWLDYQMTCI